MPQNPPNITESPEFKDFVKNNNLEVFNLESFQLALYSLAFYQKYQDDVSNLQNQRIQQLEERLMEAWKEIKLDYHPECDVYMPNEPKTLADKWK